MNKQVKERYILVIGGLIFLITVFVIGRLREKNIHDQLAKDFRVTYGNIISIGSVGRSPGGAKYSYCVNGNSFEGHINISRFCTRHRKDLCIFEDLDIPVIYSPEKPDVSLILLKHSEYREWGLAYPDSIKRKLHFYFECKKSYSAVREERKGINPKWRKCDD